MFLKFDNSKHLYVLMIALLIGIPLLKHLILIVAIVFGAYVFYTKKKLNS